MWFFIDHQTHGEFYAHVLKVDHGPRSLANFACFSLARCDDKQHLRMLGVLGQRLQTKQPMHCAEGTGMWSLWQARNDNC